MPHPTLIHQRVAEANDGTNPKVIARMKSGWAVIGDTQFLKGYCLLLPDPVVADLNDFTGDQHLAFLDDMVTLGQAILDVTNATRINYEMLGNLEPALHAHLFPRYDDEPEELRTKPAWFYSHEVRDSLAFDLQRDRPIMDAIKAELETKI
jgi:diadenosine tetraphosphate (Ap4A) HIT family hydrolase